VRQRTLLKDEVGKFAGSLHKAGPEWQAIAESKNHEKIDEWLQKKTTSTLEKKDVGQDNSWFSDVGREFLMLIRDSMRMANNAAKVALEKLDPEKLEPLAMEILEMAHKIYEWGFAKLHTNKLALIKNRQLLRSKVQDFNLLANDVD